MNPSEVSVYASVLPPPGDLSKPEIEIIQSRLRELGYHIVGLVDGHWGARTVGALSSLQSQAGLPVTGQYDEAVMAAMKSNRHRLPISTGRAAVTVSDLRAEGSKTIKAADRIGIGSLLLTCISGVVAMGTFVANHWDEASKMSEAIRPILEWIPAPIWPAVVALMGLFLFLKSGAVKNARVEAERAGVHNGESVRDVSVADAPPEPVSP